MTQGKRLSIAQIVIVTTTMLTGTFTQAQTIATWVGPTNGGLYSTAGNWNPASVPINNEETFSAIIPMGNIIKYDIDRIRVVSGLALESGSTLLLRRPEDDPLASVEFIVVAQASIDGIIDADGADFTASGTQLSGDQTRVYAAGGGRVIFDATGEYSTVGIRNGETILSADGMDSQIKLSLVETLNAEFFGFGGPKVQTVAANDEGVIDLSAVTEVFTPSRTVDHIEFTASNGAEINLSALHTISGAGSAALMANNSGTITLGPLTSVSNVLIDMDSTGRVVAPGNLTLGLGATVQVEVSPLSASRIEVAGEVSLGGDLEIELIGSFAQQILREYDLLVADEIIGEFGNISGNLLTTSNEQALIPVLVRGEGDDPDILKLVATAWGDANLDLKVDAADLNTLALHWQQGVGAWQDADFNDDGIVNAADLNLLAINWQVGVLSGNDEPSSISFASAWKQALANASIPEPVSGLVWVVGMGAVTRTHRRI